MSLLLVLGGWLAGAVVNLLADTLPLPRPQIFHGPRCPACGLAYPLEHWLALPAALAGRNRCPYCAAPRGRRPALVELGAALGAGYLWVWAGGDAGRFAAAAVISLSFLLIGVIDFERRLILWRTVWVSALLFLVIGGLAPDRGWQKTLIGGLAGYGFVAVLFLAGGVYSYAVARLRGRPLDEVAFGGGDVNLAGLIGLAVGWSGVVVALFLGVLAAGLFSLSVIALQLLRRRYDPHMPFAYGPFLILGGLAVYLYGHDLAAWWLAGR